MESEVGRLAQQTHCCKCAGPLYRVVDGRWCGQWPLGAPGWMCLPCAFLHRNKTDGHDVPNDFRPEWNRTV
jgi:Zn-finger protein